MEHKPGEVFDKLYPKIQADLYNLQMDAEEKMLYMYQEAYESIIVDIAALYEKYSTDGKLTYSEMTKYHRLKNLEKQISEKMHPRLRKMDEYIKKITIQLYEESFYQHSIAIQEDVGVELKWGLLREVDIQDIVNSPLNKLSDSKLLMSDRINAVYKIRKGITLGLVRGEGYPEMAKRVKNVIGITESRSGLFTAQKKGLMYRSTRIVRTEGQRAVVAGQMKSYAWARELGIEVLEVWDAAFDLKVRPEHRKLNGVEKQEKGWFVRGIGWVEGPLMSGVAEFDIHCRCRVRGKLR